MIKLILFFSFLSSVTFAVVDSQESEILKKLEALTQMREALSSGVTQLKPSEITEQTFKQVCQPVGVELKRWAGEKGYTARQISLKPRGSNATPRPNEVEILNSFKKDTSKNSFRFVTTEAEIQSISVYRRIQMAQSCLACHGDKERRPDFIKTKYPKDQAFGFKAGDFRGLYVVTFQK